MKYTFPVLNVLTDIAQNVEINADEYCIKHPAYPELRLADTIIEKLQKLSPTVQQECLSLQLRNFLHGAYFTGLGASENNINADLSSYYLGVDTILGPDLAFFRQLDEKNLGKGHFEPGWEIVEQLEANKLKVQKAGLTLLIDRYNHMLPVDQVGSPGDLVTVWMPHNRVRAGFYVAVGNANSSASRVTDADSGQAQVTLYFNCNLEGALGLMQCLTQKLNCLELAFYFRVPYNPGSYPRWDAGMLVFSRCYFPEVRKVLQEIYPYQQSNFSPEIPLLTKPLAPGLGLAETQTSQDFGLHHCQLLANGLLAAKKQQDEGMENRFLQFDYHFSQENINLELAYLVTDCQDIYEPLYMLTNN
jgi:hypothetical protein